MSSSRVQAEMRRIASAMTVVGGFVAVAMAVSAFVLGLERAGFVQLDAIKGHPIYKLQ